MPHRMQARKEEDPCPTFFYLVPPYAEFGLNPVPADPHRIADLPRRLVILICPRRSCTRPLELGAPHHNRSCRRPAYWSQGVIGILEPAVDRRIEAGV